jgi:hypothetical protein
LKFAILCTLVLTLTICIATLTPLPLKIDAPGSDKWHHFVAFAALVYPITVANRFYWIPIIIFGFALGGLIEVVQPFVNRFGDIQDFQADIVGMLMGFLIGLMVRQLKFHFIK